MALGIVSYKLEAEGQARLCSCELDLVLCQSRSAVDGSSIYLNYDWVIQTLTAVPHQLVARDTAASILGGGLPSQSNACAITSDPFRS